MSGDDVDALADRLAAVDAREQPTTDADILARHAKLHRQLLTRYCGACPAQLQQQMHTQRRLQEIEARMTAAQRAAAAQAALRALGV